MASFAYFFYSGVFTVATSEAVTFYFVASVVSSLFLTAIFLMAFYSLCWAGQQLEDRRDDARFEICNFSNNQDTVYYFSLREALEDAVVEHRQYMDEETASALRLVASRLDAPSAPISPCSAFAVNHSGYLNTIATSITYLIVLAQFKVAE